MPFAEENIIAKLEENLSGISSVTSMLDAGMTPEQILEKLFDGMDMEIVDTIPTQFSCNCDKHRIEKAIISIGAKDIQEMIDDGKEIEVKCHFCNTNYKFSVDELKALMKQCKR
jgi:molecular chaperone Hsp33